MPQALTLSYEGGLRADCFDCAEIFARIAEREWESLKQPEGLVKAVRDCTADEHDNATWG